MTYQIWAHPSSGDDYCYEFKTENEAKIALSQLRKQHPRMIFKEPVFGESMDEMIIRLEKEANNAKNI